MFEVDSLAKANWAMDKIAEKRKKIEEVEDAFNEIVKRYEDWYNKETKTLQAEIDSLSHLLRPWVEAELAGSKKKSVNFANGRAGFRKGKEIWSIGGEMASAVNPALIEWTKNNAKNYIVKKESVRWGDLKKHLIATPNGKVVTDDGEIIEGLTVKQEPDEFYIK